MPSIEAPVSMLLLLSGVVAGAAVLAAVLLWRRLVQADRQLGHAREQATRAHQDLILEQRRRLGVVNGTNVATWEVATDDGAVDIDERWASMLGYRRDELIASRFDPAALVHPDDLAEGQAAMQATMAGTRETFEVDVRLKHADGHWVWIASRGYVIERHPDGRAARVAGVHIDISERKAAELALRQSEARFRSLFDLSSVGICLVECETGRMLAFNDAFLAMYRYRREELLGLSCWKLGSPEERGDDTTRVELIHQTGRNDRYERQAVRRDGSVFTAQMSSFLAHEGDRKVIWSVVEDITDRKQLEAQLTAAVVRDRLTGLASRGRFLERLQRALARVQSGDQAMFAVLFLDCDRFKRVNDAMGHAAGDQLLQEIANRLSAVVRVRRPREDEADVVARFGGDEFLVLLNNLSDPSDAERVADRILGQVAAPVVLRGRDVQVGASIGIVTSEHGCADAESVIRNADVAMYEAKSGGRNRWVLFNPAMHDRSARKLAVESGLRRALDARQLSVVYQPIIDLTDGRMASAEALVRWTDPELGVVSPVEFIPIAEESSLIVGIGRHVLRTACLDYVRWQHEDPQRAPRTLSVNVSRAELALGREFVDGVVDVLAAFGVTPSALQLEVTEREVMEDADAARQVLQALRDRGIRVAMDDFGTGTSSLACLRDYPFDVIKIDRSFVVDVAGSADLLAVMHATITLAENLGKSCVAEGVEQPTQVAILQSLGCRYAQGYLFSRPVPAAALLGVPLATRAVA
jgi:diguanylate cyclase (GGDEF)-like protein/PAS domain S-box-containing protein